MLEIKNKKLHKQTFIKLNKFDNLAIKNYHIGNMKKGKHYEKLSDDLYKKNYHKIFRII